MAKFAPSLGANRMFHTLQLENYDWQIFRLDTGIEIARVTSKRIAIRLVAALNRRVAA
jgi:hypothetical protein